MPQNQPMDHTFNLLLMKIHQERGLNFTQYRPACLKRRIDTRLRFHKISSYLEYINLLNQYPQEYEKLLDVATINVTEFFRDPLVWSVLQKSIFPKIIEEKTKRNSRIIRLWSAGSSGGEEAYTASIVFHELLGPRINDFRIKIFGTDIDEGSLNRAAQGEYGRQSLKHIKPHLLDKYFTPTGSTYVLSDQIRLITNFQKHNMIDDEPLNYIDLIFCRNVMIYFSRELQIKVVDNFQKALQKDGYFVIGKSESLWGNVSRYFEVVDDQERIYRKR